MDALQKITEAQMDANGVCSAPNVLNGTVAQNKAVFDKMVRQLVAPAYNAAVDAIGEINATETGIQAEEALRVTAESGRVAAENARAAAEIARESTETGYVAQAAASAATAVAKSGEAVLSATQAAGSAVSASESADRAAQVVLGQIPDASLTMGKMAPDVTAELAGKVNANNRTTLNLDTAITTGHWTWTDDNGVFGITGALYNIDVSSSDFSANPSIVQTATRTHPVNEAYPSITLKRTFYFTSGWTAWVQQGTATPPEEYDLPLEAGYTAIRACKFFKTQNGVVTVYGQVDAGATIMPSYFVVATLPVGYRPIAEMSRPTTGLANPAYTAGEAIIKTTGEIVLSGVTNCRYAYFSASFVAGN